MRKFLLTVCISLLSFAAAADPASALAGIKAFRAPMTEIVREAAKGKEADFAMVGKYSAEAGQAWKTVMSEPLDLDRMGVPAAAQEDVWRQLRLLEMLVGYLDESVRRGDRALMLRAAGMLQPAYDKVAGALGAN